MALLATEPRIAFDRRYPFENRWLTYLVKFSLLTGRPGPSGRFDAVQLTDYYDDHFGPVPWWPPEPADGMPLMPASSGCFRGLWQEFSASARTADDRLTHYGEKVPDWLPAAICDEVPCRVIGLIRDPRDVFLSARDFVRTRGAVGFGMQPGSAELEDARNTAHRLLCYTENARAAELRRDAIIIRYEDLVRNPAQRHRQARRRRRYPVGAICAMTLVFEPTCEQPYGHSALPFNGAHSSPRRHAR